MGPTPVQFKPPPVGKSSHGRVAKHRMKSCLKAETAKVESVISRGLDLAQSAVCALQGFFELSGMETAHCSFHQKLAFDPRVSPDLPNERRRRRLQAILRITKGTGQSVYLFHPGARTAREIGVGIEQPSGFPSVTQS